MPSPIAGETSVEKRESAGLIGASQKKRRRKGEESGSMSPEEDSTASPPTGLIAGREEGQQRLTSPPSGSKFVHDQMPRDEFGETRLEESTIIKNRSDDGSSDECEEEAMDDDENVDDESANKMEMKQFSGGAEDSWSTTDVENFDGKIVYNPDGSAYIIEDSELSDEDAVELPQLIGNGCIVDGRGVKVTCSEGFPPIANAIYVSSRNQGLHHTLYGNVTSYAKSGLPDKSTVPEVPIMHSYRVYSVRDSKYERDRNNQEREYGLSGKDCSSVPVKPILMCFVCKLSFGYAKSFVAHAMSDHNVLLQDDEKDILSHKNTSAIIQCVGKEKEPLVSFLEPLSPPIAASSLDGKYRPSVGQSSFSSTFGENNNTQKVPNNNNNNNNNSNSSSNNSSCINSTPVRSIADGNGSSDFNDNKNGAVSLVTHRRDRSPISSSQNQHVPETSVSLPSPSPGSTTVSPSPGSTTVSPLLSTAVSPSMSSFPQHPPNFLTGTTIGVCPDHMGGRPSGVDCPKCELILSSSRLGGVGGGPLAGMHSRNSCKTLKCPKCNWHYKYQETLEIHMKEKHPETETSCIYCIAGQPHPRLARGETYTCGYKPYRCEVCNYSTTTKGNLSIHMQSDKHLNNMQELQNGTVTNSDLTTHQQSTPPVPQQHSKPTGMSSPGAGGSGMVPYHSNMPSNQTQKPKPTFRCEVCNYETNVARNLRIHMTSEKHTHNILVLQQNMKQMQALSAIQQSQHQQQLNFEQLLHFHPGLTLPGEKPPPHSEAALADMAYNQALIIQLMTGGQLPPHMSPELSPNLDMGLNPETMEPPPEPADPNPENIYQCCVCNIFTTDSLEALSHHLAADRTKIREQEILAIVAGHYVCKLCTYKTTLKANFQLHCKTDKHLQRLQHVNHIKEGGVRNEWKLKYVSSPGGVQIRCNACDYYTNSIHKLQLHSAAQRHEFSATLFRHLRDSQRSSPSSSTVSSGGKDVDVRCGQSDSSKADTEDADEMGDQLEAEGGVHCPTCAKTFRSSDELSVHQNESGHFDMKSVESVSSFLCPKKDCVPSFCTNNVSYRCLTCAKTFHTANELCLHQNENAHFEMKQIEGVSAFLCPKKDCNAYFATTLNVQRHYLEVHIQRNRVNTVAVSEKHVYKYRCSQCSLAFKTMEKLQLHSQYHFIRDATKCVLCGRSFRSIIALQKHVESSHADLSEEEMLIFKQSLLSNPLLLAGLSGQVLDPSITELLKKESLRMDTDESLDEENATKEAEDSSATVGGTENSDEEDETYREQFIEDYLNSQTIAEENYNDPNRKYKCHKCKMAFTRQSYLTLHNKKVPHRKGEKVIYPMEKYLDPNRPYKCVVCKESFTQKNILLVHYNSVSHLHKLKRASQDSHNNLSQSTPGSLSTSSNLMISPPTNQILTPKSSSSACTTPTSTMPFTQVSELKTPSPAQSLTSTAVDDSFMKLPSEAKKPSHMYKHLLESFGFDLVMQFNENHQRRQRKEREESERLLAELQSAQFMSEEMLTDETKKENSQDLDKVDKEELPSTDELPEVSKSTCAHCNKEFSSVWVLKAHCEEVHKDLVPLDFLEKYAQQIKCEIEKKVPDVVSSAVNNDGEINVGGELITNKTENVVAVSSSVGINAPILTTADVGTDVYASHREDHENDDESDGVLNMSIGPKTTNSSLYDDSEREIEDNKDIPLRMTVQTTYDSSVPPNPPAACSTPTSNTESRMIVQNTHDSSVPPNPPTACSTPASSTESIPPTLGGVASSNPSPNIPLSLAQQMNEMQAALNAMAASQLQQQLQQFSPMMMGMAGLGMGLPLGLNMPALAAMNLQPPLVPMMMPPPSFDPIVGLGPTQNPLFQQQASNIDSTSILAKQQQHLIQQQQVVNASQQKRARTRITDDQLKILRAHFDINNSPSEEQINKMAAESGLPPKVIKHWFRNTLFKERQRNKDSPYNFNNPPSTTLNLEEYEKTGEAKVMTLSSSNASDENIQNNNVDSSKLNISMPVSKKSCTSMPTPTTAAVAPKIEQLSPHFQSHSLPQQSPSFSVPRSVASSPVSIKSEPKDTPQNLVDSQPLHHKFNNVLQLDADSRIKKEEYEDVKSNLYMQERESRSPSSPNISERIGSVPTPCSSPENLTVSSVFNSQHLSSELSATSSPMLNVSLHSGNNMLPPPKLNPNFSSASQPLSNTNFNSSISNRSLSPGRSNTVDCFSHNILSSGNSNGSNSSGGSSGKRANRTRFTDYQIKVLQEFFENNAYPKDDDLEYLSKLLSLSPRVIVVWFQNARQKARKVYENQPPVEPVTGMDENTGRFQRTPGLNYQCKKCLLVFQRYYELIRHQKTHCFKEEDAKRSAQAQAAAAQMAAVLSSEDSNSSTIIEQNQQCNVTNSNPSTPAAAVTPTPSMVYPTSPVQPNPSTPESKENTLQCENCNLVFSRFELWREHQLIHIMNPNLFPNYPPESPFGILQQQAQQQQQQQTQLPQSQQQLQQQLQQSQSQAPTQSQSNHDQFLTNTSTVADVTSNSNPTSPHPLLAMFNSNKRKYEEYVYLSDRDADQPKDKRLRTTISPEQLEYLYQKYQIESNPSRKMLENIANEVGLKKRVVQVWFQNTRARERKGQFRAHSQVINKRCPFCPALFKVKSALETHLTTKHTDQCSRGEINIDALPDEGVSMDSNSFLTPPQATNELNNKCTNYSTVGNGGGSTSSMIHPLFQSAKHGGSTSGENDVQFKKYYEDSLRRYLNEIQSQQQEQQEQQEQQQPVDLSNPIKFPTQRVSNGPSASDVNDRNCEEDYSESECSENMDDDSGPASPASSTQSSQRTSFNSNDISSLKLFLPSMTKLQFYTLKCLFNDQKSPSANKCDEMGRILGLPKRVIQQWFQDARVKDKKYKDNSSETENKLPDECRVCPPITRTNTPYKITCSPRNTDGQQPGGGRLVERRGAGHRLKQQDSDGVVLDELQLNSSTLQLIIDACGDGGGGSGGGNSSCGDGSVAQADSSIIVNEQTSEINGTPQKPVAGECQKIELSYVCKKCRLVFRSRSAACSHQIRVDHCGESGVLQVKRLVYMCEMGDDHDHDEQRNRFVDAGDLQNHFELNHQSRCASPLADEMENVVNQITALAAAKAAATQNTRSQSDPNGNIFCKLPSDPSKKSKLFAMPNTIATEGGH